MVSAALLVRALSLSASAPTGRSKSLRIRVTGALPARVGEARLTAWAFLLGRFERMEKNYSNGDAAMSRERGEHGGTRAQRCICGSRKADARGRISGGPNRNNTARRESSRVPSDRSRVRRRGVTPENCSCPGTEHPRAPYPGDLVPTEKASASFLSTARSLNLCGPADWSTNLDNYLHGDGCLSRAWRFPRRVACESSQEG